MIWRRPTTTDDLREQIERERESRRLEATGHRHDQRGEGWLRRVDGSHGAPLRGRDDARDDDRSERRTGTEEEVRGRHDDGQHPRRPKDPSDIRKPNWKLVAKRAWYEFNDDGCTDLAAGLTYFAVMSIAPALLAIVSLLGVFGNGRETTDSMLDIIKDLGAPASALEPVQTIITNVQTAPAAGIALVTGLLVALWSASNYVNGFSRMMNRIYEVGEGRPIWKLRPWLLLVTLVELVLVVLMVTALGIAGPVTERIGEALGLGSTAVTVWGIAKWPLIAVVMMIAIQFLYWATPNVKQPRGVWLTPGAIFAFLAWVVASLVMGLYIGRFGNYDATYGSLAGVIVLLLWLWVTNVVLLLGAEVDAELERGRQLQKGMAAEQDLQLPVRDDKNIEKKAEKEEQLIEQARAVRVTAGASASPSDAPSTR